MRVDLEAHGRRYSIDVDPKTHIGRLIAEGHAYERPLLEQIYRRQFGGIAVDVGAHIGNHSLYFAAVCGLEVAAFEPQYHEALSANVAGYPVTVHPVALGAEDGVAEHVGDDAFETGRGSTPVRTLDSFQLSDVAFIKADVEGMESDVLRGGLNTLKRCRPVVYAESWGEEWTAKIAEVLAPLGYERTKVVETATLVEQWEIV